MESVSVSSRSRPVRFEWCGCVCVEECVCVVWCSHMQRLGCRLVLVGHLGPAAMEPWWLGPGALSGPSLIDDDTYDYCLNLISYNVMSGFMFLIIVGMCIVGTRRRHCWSTLCK